MAGKDTSPRPTSALASLVVAGVFCYGFFADAAPRCFVVPWLAALLLGVFATLRTGRQRGPLEVRTT